MRSHTPLPRSCCWSCAVASSVRATDAATPGTTGTAPTRGATGTVCTRGVTGPPRARRRREPDDPSCGSSIATSSPLVRYLTVAVGPGHAVHTFLPSSPPGAPDLEGIDFVDADEPSWVFALASCVGRIESLLVRGLIVLTDESGCQLYCGRSADDAVTWATTTGRRGAELPPVTGPNSFSPPQRARGKLVRAKRLMRRSAMKAAQDTSLVASSSKPT